MTTEEQDAEQPAAPESLRSVEQPALVQISPACLTGQVEDLPRCSWEEFAAAMGIKNAATAKDLLDKLAADYRASRTPSIPDEIVDMADRYCCDPYVVWLWSLDPDFRPEPEGVAYPFANSTNPANYYLLSVMVEFCTEVPTKNTEDLVKDCIHDRELYDVVRLQVLRERGCPAVSLRFDPVFA